VNEISISVRRDPTNTTSWLVVDAIPQYSASTLDLDLIIAKERVCFCFSRDKIILWWTISNRKVGPLEAGWNFIGDLRSRGCSKYI
jgi:hypothetical protein